jgi:RNA polymerase sigma-70 factor (ECF subfamily)
VGTEPTAAENEPGPALLALYDDALPHVYGYLLSRCGGHVAVAQDLTTQTFLAAVQAVRRDAGARPSRPWLMTVARNKLVDHWRRQAREERGLRTVAADQASFHDPWDAELDHLRVQAVLARLSAHHRMVLTLRYLDDLPVPEVAVLAGRTLHATEALLVRARAAFRRAYTTDDEGEVPDA